MLKGIKLAVLWQQNSNVLVRLPINIE